ncbi:MAG: tetratricopeptide repeat protein [Anaerolineae bacterium]|nr:MAG: tetratricopeptide repeat protein [Anaerolineae bacterium]
MRPASRTSLQILGLLGVIAIACNMQRVLDPSLPTSTPPAPDSVAVATLLPPSPTPIATPEPGARIEEGDRAMFLGDWDTALAAYQSAQLSSTDPQILAATTLGIARVQFASGNPASALDTLNLFFAQSGESPDRGLAFFLAGQSYSALGRYPEAALAFGEYRAARPGLADQLAYDRIGNNLMAAGDYQGAINAWLSAVQSPQLGDGLSTNIKIGDAYRAMGDYQTALITYQDVFSRTSNGYVKASMLLRIGEMQIAMGDSVSAYQSYLLAVNEYPLAYDSYIALITLVEAGQPVSELQRGLVDYYAGQYGVAVSAFDRHRQLNPSDLDDTAHYFAGLSYQATGQYEAALAEWNQQLELFPAGQHLADAWEQIGYTQWAYLEDYPAAVDTFVAFADTYPDHSRTPEFLYNAGRVAERDNDLRRAAAIWQRLGANYSASEFGPDGLFQAGIALYRLADFALARDVFQSALTLAPDLEGQARAYFWAGKALDALGDHDGAQSMWSQARTLDPTGYYSERAAQLMRGDAPFTQIPLPTLTIDPASERQEAETWMIATFGLPQDTDFADLSSLASDLRFQRGTEMWRLGLYNEARLEFENLRLEIVNDPANTYRLANYLIDLGLYRSGILAARQVLNLVGYDDAGTFQAPIYFNRLRFGLYFEELVNPAGQANGFSPLFLSSVIRQESLFEGFVTSSADARGLMQIIPSTGQSIFEGIGWPANYTDEDLYRPVVNITFGADYLAAQREAFSGDLIAALAAYNGGPGNASRWRELAGGDPDLLVEVIRFEETRNYVRSIFEQYVIYVRLYGGIP